MHLYRVIGLMTWLLLTAVPSMAAFGGLVIIPTADVLDAGHYDLELQVDGSLPDRTASTRFINTQFGFGGRTEAGIDLDLTAGTKTSVLFNAKYAFGVSPKRNLALATGIYSSPPNVANVPYVVVSKCFGVFRLHVGGQYDNGAGHWFAGVDKAVGDRWTLMADHTQGDANYSSAGVNYQLSDKFGILAGAQFPNAGGDVLYTVHFVLGGNYQICPRRD